VNPEPLGLPTLTFEDEALLTPGFPPEVVAAVADAFNSAGCVLIERVLDVAIVDAMHDAFIDRYHRYLDGQHHDDALEVGPRRIMVTVALEPPFAEPEVYANPKLLPILDALLHEVRLFGFGGVAALPGSTEQGVHRDDLGLFHDVVMDGAVPPYAVSVLIPLVDMRPDTTGTMRVWPGSHREFVSGSEFPFPPVDPLIRRGSALLMDYRLYHNGTENHSSDSQPILYNVYARPWYRDVLKYRKQPPLVISQDELARVPDEHKGLFA